MGTLLAVYGVFMNPLGWALTAFVWGYTLLSFFITGVLKIPYFKLIRAQINET
jgi:H+-transporting ATPase